MVGITRLVAVQETCAPSRRRTGWSCAGCARRSAARGIPADMGGDDRGEVPARAAAADLSADDDAFAGGALRRSSDPARGISARDHAPCAIEDRVQIARGPTIPVTRRRGRRAVAGKWIHRHLSAGKWLSCRSLAYALPTAGSARTAERSESVSAGRPPRRGRAGAGVRTPFLGISAGAPSPRPRWWRRRSPPPESASGGGGQGREPPATGRRAEAPGSGPEAQALLPTDTPHQDLRPCPHHPAATHRGSRTHPPNEWTRA